MAKQSATGQGSIRPHTSLPDGSQTVGPLWKVQSTLVSPAKLKHL